MTSGANRWRGVRPELQRPNNWLIDWLLQQQHLKTKSIWERETDRQKWMRFSVLVGNCHHLNKQTISFLPRSAGLKLQNCLDRAQTYKGICSGFYMLRDLFLSVPFIIKNHQRSKSNYRQCVNVSHQRTMDLVNEWGLLKMSRCKRNNMGKHSFLVLNIWLMSYMCPTHRSSLASWMA